MLLKQSQWDSPDLKKTKGKKNLSVTFLLRATILKCVLKDNRAKTHVRSFYVWYLASRGHKQVLRVKPCVKMQKTSCSSGALLWPSAEDCDWTGMLPNLSALSWESVKRRIFFFNANPEWIRSSSPSVKRVPHMQISVLVWCVAATTTNNTPRLLQLMTSVNPEAREHLKAAARAEAFSTSLPRLLVHNNSLLGTRRALEESRDAEGKKSTTEQTCKPLSNVDLSPGPRVPAAPLPWGGGGGQVI